MLRKHQRWPLVFAAVVALALAAAACGGDEQAAEEPSPVEPQANQPVAGECPFEGGRITAFQTNDLAAVSGDLGPSHARATELWVDVLNAEGGILGCELVIDVIDEPFPDLDQCLRNWREALRSGKYDFFLGPFNSACMAAVPDLTNAAGKALIASNAADHQPFFQNFQKYNFHAAVSTFLEGRASAAFAADQGWKRISTLVPNYAYGQDAGKAFSDYFLQLVPDGEIVEEQFPEFDETNFTAFINALVAPNPDAVFSAFFGPFVVPFWKQWQASGNDDIPTIGGLIDTPTFEILESENAIPENAYGYDRGFWELLSQTAVGAKFTAAYEQRFGESDHPIPSAWTYGAVSGIQMAKALIEKTQSLEPDDWVAAVEAGDFSFESPYNDGPTYVNPVNHMADTCAQVALVTWDESLPVPATYDLDTMQNYCMRDILPAEEARELTDNPDVSDEAVQTYYDLVGGEGS